MAGQNSAGGHDRESLRRMLETAKPRNDPDRRHFGFFVYQQPSTFAQRELSLSELLHFVKNMHGELAPSPALVPPASLPLSNLAACSGLHACISRKPILSPPAGELGAH